METKDPTADEFKEAATQLYERVRDQDKASAVLIIATELLGQYIKGCDSILDSVFLTPAAPEEKPRLSLVQP